jgi:hypothetical protein
MSRFSYFTCVADGNAFVMHPAAATLTNRARIVPIRPSTIHKEKYI